MVVVVVVLVDGESGESHPVCEEENVGEMYRRETEESDEHNWLWGLGQ